MAISWSMESRLLSKASKSFRFVCAKQALSYKPNLLPTRTFFSISNIKRNEDETVPPKQFNDRENIAKDIENPAGNTESVLDKILAAESEKREQQLSTDVKKEGGQAFEGYISSQERQREQMARRMMIGFSLLAFVGILYECRSFNDDEEKLKSANPDIASGYSPVSMYYRMKARINAWLKHYQDPVFPQLLPDPLPEPYNRPLTLVLELDDVLLHSEWTREHGWRTAKRPGLDYFLGYLSQYYEIVIFTRQPMALALPVVQSLDKYHTMILAALARDAAKYENGKYIKDLSYMNRPLSKIILVDCFPESWEKQPENAIKLKPWDGNPDDKELVGLIPLLEYIAATDAPDVRPILQSYDGKHIPTEYAKRELALRQTLLKQWNTEQENRKKNFIYNIFDRLTLASKQAPPQLFIDQQRQRAQAAYAEFQKYLEKHGPSILEEEKKREKEHFENMKSSMFGFLGGPKNQDSVTES